MKISTIVLLVLVMSIGSEGAQREELGSISGFVYADEDNVPLRYANIVIVGTTLGAMSDSTGFFQIENIPAGVHIVKVLMMGYRRLEVSDVVVRSNSDTKQEYRIDPLGLSKTAAARESLGVDVRVHPDDLSCEIVPLSDPFHVGDQPRFDIRIRNNSNKEFFLIPKQEAGWYPVVKLTVYGTANGMESPKLFYGGDHSGIDDDDFRFVGPGDAFDPMEGSWSLVEAYAKFLSPGTYVVRFEYSTDEPDVRRWHFPMWNEFPLEISALIRRVPRITVSDSVIVKVVQ